MAATGCGHTHTSATSKLELAHCVLEVAIVWLIQQVVVATTFQRALVVATR